MVIQKLITPIVVVFLMALGWAPVRAEEVINLNQVLILARANHPRMIAAWQELRAAQGRAIQARAWSNPELAALYASGREGQEEGEVSLEQEVDFPGKRGAKMAVGDAEIALSLEKINQVWSETAFETKLACYSLLLAGKRKELALENLNFFRKLLESAQIEYQSGQVAMSEVSRAQVELFQAENECFLRENELQEARAGLSQHLNRPPEQAFSLGDSLTFIERTLDYSALAVVVKENNVDLKSSRRLIESNRLALELIQREAWPSPRVGVTGRRNEGDVFIGGSIRFALPIWNQNQGLVAEAEANLEKCEQSAAVLEKQLRIDLYAACTDAEYAAKRVANMKKSLEQSSGLLIQADTLYREGKASFLMYLDTLRAVKNVKQGYFEAVADYQIKLALIDKLANQDPNIAMEANNE